MGLGTGQDDSSTNSNDDATDVPGKAKEFLKRVHALTVPSWFPRWFLGFLGAARVLKGRGLEDPPTIWEIWADSGLLFAFHCIS